MNDVTFLLPQAELPAEGMNVWEISNPKNSYISDYVVRLVILFGMSREL
jgi:hypothetical protein